MKLATVQNSHLCPVCGHHRANKKHTARCSQIMRQRINAKELKRPAYTEAAVKQNYISDDFVRALEKSVDDASDSDYY